MSTPTAARPIERKDSHWYTAAGEPRYEVMGKTTGKPRPVTLRDAKTDNLVPSVTTILKLLHKEGLVNWRIEQCILAVLTSPRKDGEELDAFVERIIHTEEVPMLEARQAADKGTQIHAALELYFTGQEVPEDIRPWIIPAAEALQAYGTLVATERILVGDGYAGKTDLILDAPECWWVWDYKSTKKLPTPDKGGAWIEHRLQLSAYAQALEDSLAGSPTGKPIRTGNLYISSVEEGKFVICEHEPWATTYSEGFAPLCTHWQWANKYRPVMPGREKVKPAAVARVTPPEMEAAPEPTDSPGIPNPKNLPPGKKVAWSTGVITRQ